MNRKVYRVLMGVAALTSTFAFSSCASDKEEAADNPNYDPQTNTVTADFVFNVGGGATNRTRMSSANTQATASDRFRGMQDVKVLAFQENGADGSLVTNANYPEDKVKVFDLGQIVTAGQITQPTYGADNKEEDRGKSHRVVELPIPVRTNAIMFYGRAYKDGDAVGQGVINGEKGIPESGVFNVGTKLSEIEFKLTNRLKESDKSKMETIEALIAGICTRIVQNGLKKEGQGDNSDDANRNLSASFWWPDLPEGAGPNPADNSAIVKGWTDETKTAVEAYYTNAELATEIESITDNTSREYMDNHRNVYTYYHNIEKSWKDYGEQYYKMKNPVAGEAPVTMVPLEEILGRAYYLMVSIEGEGVRAGSGAAIARTMTDLWYIVSQVYRAKPTNADELLAKKLAERLCTRFSTYFDDPNPSGSTYDTEADYDPKLTLTDANATIKWTANAGRNYETYSGITDKGYAAITSDDLEGFPHNLMLPMGAAQLVSKADPSNTGYTMFDYADAPNFHLGGDTYNGTSFDDLMYPSELMYYCNSPIRVSATTKTSSDYPEGVNHWNTEADWTADWASPSHVQSSTRAVAVMHDINYGNALLETRVKIDDVVLKDNREHFFPGEGDAEISDADRNFTLTGILIGGQPGSVDWQYLPKADTNSKVIYDREIPDNAKQVPVATYGGPNYTMVLDNANKENGESTYTQANQQKVYVALEFTNGTGRDFWGDHNIVRKDGTFYLVGVLDPNAADVSKPSWETLDDKYRSTPPYQDGKTQQLNRVFIQDFVTKARFTIGEKSLQSAFVTVPDLRSAEISLGLNVDLKWENGMEFYVVLGK